LSHKTGKTSRQRPRKVIIVVLEETIMRMNKVGKGVETKKKGATKKFTPTPAKRKKSGERKCTPRTG